MSYDQLTVTQELHLKGSFSSFKCGHILKVDPLKSCFYFFLEMF